MMNLTHGKSCNFDHVIHRDSTTTAVDPDHQDIDNRHGRGQDQFKPGSFTGSGFNLDCTFQLVDRSPDNIKTYTAATDISDLFGRRKTWQEQEVVYLFIGKFLSLLLLY